MLTTLLESEIPEIVDIETVFDNTFTRRFGFPRERPASKVKGYLMENAKDFIRRSPFLVMATSGADGSCDASPKGGKSGFVKILDDSTLIVPDVAGNRLFQSYLNIQENPNGGLAFFIPGVRDTVRVNGRAKIVSDEELSRLQIDLEVHNPDDNSRVLQGMVVEIHEAYTHCPRALAFSQFWDERPLDADKPGPEGTQQF
jgi:PPOX class probable FMN-dependent enzyme